MPSVVRIHLRPRYYYYFDCGSSSVDRASAFQAEGREFEPRLPLIKGRSGEDGPFLVYDGRLRLPDQRNQENK